jgi:DnaK suppressor protein
MAEQQLEAVRESLTARRAELLRMIAATEGDRKPVDLDQTTVGRLSRMGAMQQQAMAMETERRRVAELQRIEAALRRIDEGEYGYCVSCGEEIAPKRLELDPTTPTCINCARLADR